MRLLALAAFLFLRDVSSCSIAAVGKAASATGFPIVTHTDDGGPVNDFRLVRVPRKQWPAGSVRNIYHWQDRYPRMVSSNFMTPDYAPLPGQFERTPVGTIPQIAETWAYWDIDYGMMNEWGLSVGESTSNAKTVGWPKDVAYGYNLLGIEDLSKIALERCKTAKCAAQTMGDLAVQHGFYSADSGDPAKPGYSDAAEVLVLADTEDVWIWNVMTGKHNASAIWAAKRIPDDHVAIVADSFSFSLDLHDPSNNIYSEGVADLAMEMGWRKTATEQPGHFDFFAAYGAELEGEEKTVMGYYVGRRIWRGYTLLAPEEGAKIDPGSTHLANGGRMPESVAARPGSVTLEMVFALHRDHFEGTPYDLTVGMAAGPFGNPNRQDQAGPGQWERAWSLQRTICSYVLEPRPNGRGVAWFNYDAPHGSPFMPFYAGATGDAPLSFHSKEGDMSVFSRDVAWWAFNLVNTWSTLNFKVINGEVKLRCQEKEAEAMLLMRQWEAEADAAAGTIPGVMHPPALAQRAALDVLTQRSNEFNNGVVTQWWAFADHLFSKYSRSAVDYTEEDEGTWAVPLWWLNSTEVGFRSWTPEGPYHGVACPVGKPCAPYPADVAISVPATALSLAVPIMEEAEAVFEPRSGAVLVPYAVVVGALPLSLSLGAAMFWLGMRCGRQEIETQKASGYAFLAA